LGNLSTPKSVQKLQTALHAKAKAEAASPLRSYIKCCAISLYDEGLRGESLLGELEAMIPGWRWAFGKEISRHALVQRCDKARRYEREAPENNTKTWAACWSDAKRDAKARRKWTLAELRAKYPDRKPGKLAA
jgi:hypothetical protein